MVEKYSKSRDGAKKLSANFTAREFACKDGSDYILVDTELVKLLQKIRDNFGKAVTINSAYRNAAYNKKVGGATNSQHTKGTAADIVVKGVAPKDVAIYAESIMPSSGGIGLYSSFTHVDTRAKRSRWQNCGTEKSVNGFYGYSAELTTVNDIVWELHRRGIITDKSLWLDFLAKNKNAYHLAYNVCNKTVNKED